MRTPILGIAAWAITAHLFAQAPQKMSFQAVLRGSDDLLITTSPVGMRISVLQGSDQGPSAYVETHATNTNANGLAALEIGSGTVVSGSFADIDWTAGPYFLKTETDPAGGTNYSITGTSQLMSVPYALYSGTSGSSIPGPPGPPGTPGVGGCDANTKDSLIVVYDTGNAYGFSQDADGSGSWTTQAIGNANHSAVASKRTVALYSTSTAYAFFRDNAGVGTWSTQGIGNTNHVAVSTDKLIVLYDNSNAYAFHVDAAGAGVWTTQNIGNTNHEHVGHGDKIVVYNTANAYSFSLDDTGAGSWTVQNIGNTNHEVITTR